MSALKGLVRQAKRRRQRAEASSGLIFDRAYYLRRYPDVVASGLDPLAHFETVGWAEMRDPCALFDVAYYLDHNPDVAHSGLDPLAHYVAHGAKEGRRFSALFDPGFYLARNPDLAAAGVNPLAHFLTNGAAEGRAANPLFDAAWYLAHTPEAGEVRGGALAHFAEHGLTRALSPHPLFDAAWYLEQNPDVAAAGMNPLAHYLMRGWEELRPPHPLFDSAWYVAGNPDAQGTEPLAHYLSVGAARGANPNRLFDATWYMSEQQLSAEINPLIHYVTEDAAKSAKPHPVFDPAWYFERYPDVAASGMNALAHYLVRGAFEGRHPHPAFDADWYLNQYPDIAAAGVNPLIHYLETGWREGRDPSPRFDGAAYLARHPEAAGTCPLVYDVLHPPRVEESAQNADPDEDPAALEREQIAPFFDAAYYLATYPDIAAAGVDPLVHYHETGWREGRAPSKHFNAKAFFKAFPEAEAPDVCPLALYVRAGAPALDDINASHDRAAIEAYFDPKFYVATNPDLRDHDDLLAHFLEVGWKQGRDPCRSFSVTQYLAQHPDVKEAGINPFVHYRNVGIYEGRIVQRSAARRLDAAAGPPRLAVVAMVKNEIDIIEAFMAHVLALFDVIVIVDHGSEDGTRAYLDAVAARYSQVTLYDLKEPGYIQAMTMNFMVRTCPEVRDVDWLFLLDADEFLPFRDKNALHTALAALRHAPIIAMPWRNVAPTRYWDDRAQLTPETKVIWPAQPSHHRKIAFQPAHVKARHFWIDQGNHALLSRPDGEPLSSIPADFEVMHLPVRSAAQLTLKLNQGVASYEALGQGRRKQLGAHWFKIKAALNGAALTPEHLNGVVFTYGADAPIAPLSNADLLAQGAIIRQLEIALAPLECPAPARHARDPNHAQGGIDAATASPPLRLELRDGRQIHGSRDPIEFKALAAAPLPAASEQSDVRFLADFIRPSYWAYEHLTPSAWTGHIPFMYCLASLLRPRRFVELGSHYGASFFAFCQAARRGGFPTQAIAVDCWEGDEHTGKYDDGVFDYFLHVLENYSDIATWLRMFFADAAQRFDAGSVDLLHIDGFHTYEAVRADFTAWLPKMSERGVIIFHDINVHERDFGVWRFWKEVKQRYPTLEFRHSHGLGLAYVGAPGASDIERLIKLMNSSAEVHDLLQQHFEEIGQKSTDVFTKSFDLDRREAQVQALGLAKEELARLQQEVAVLRAERVQWLAAARTRLSPRS